MDYDGNPVQDGKVDYGRAFVTFTEHTDQKILHGLIFEALLAALRERDVVLKEGQPTTLVDLGCGEGHTACEMIDAINRVHPQGNGVNYYGLDADERFVLSTKRLLAEVGESKRLRAVDVRRADVLAGEPLPFASSDDVLATMGHVLYYAHSQSGREQTKGNIARVVGSITNFLGENGICLLVHSADRCSLAALRASVADSVEAKPAGIVAEIADEERLVVVSFDAPFKIFFPRLEPEQWEDCKDPSRFRLSRNKNESFVAVLELLSFIAQRGLGGLAPSGQLGPFVDEVKARIGADDVFEGISRYQLLISRRHSSSIREGVEAAARKMEARNFEV